MSTIMDHIIRMADSLPHPYNDMLTISDNRLANTLQDVWQQLAPKNAENYNICVLPASRGYFFGIGNIPV